MNKTKPTLDKLKRPATTAVRKANPNIALNMLIDSYIQEVDQEDDHLRLLILGELGTGKTCCAKTCRFPVLLDSFDPGGTTSALLKPYIKDHRILRKTIFEREKPNDPKAFERYTNHFSRLLSSGIFEKIGTYFPDSLTNLGDIIMYKVLHDRGADSTDKPIWDDYNRQQLYIINVVKQWTTIPCDVVTVGHLMAEKNDEGAVIAYNMMITGKLATKIPLLFNEIYAMRARRMKGGVKYEFQTAADARYKVRTRMGAGIFDSFEPANVKALLKKAGRDYEDLPLLEKVQTASEPAPDVTSQPELEKE